MILIDANLLVYAHLTVLPEHGRARAWLDAQLTGAEPVGLPWASLLSFVRLVTDKRIFPKAEPVAQAWSQVRDWLSCPVVWNPQPTQTHVEILGQLLAMPGLRSRLVPDVHLAALAIEHGLTLCTNDMDFARFPKLKWMNPLSA